VVELLQKYDTDGDGKLDALELKPLTEGVSIINQVCVYRSGSGRVVTYFVWQSTKS
jgi:hypothetical protein